MKLASMPILCVLFAVFAARACEANLVKQPAEITVASFNTSHCRGRDKVTDYGRVASAIRKISPDFIGLQEMDVGMSRSAGVDQAEKLAKLTGLHATFARAIDCQGGEYGNAVLSREAPMSVRRIPLPGPEPRVLILCEFTNCWFGTTHLDSGIVDGDNVPSNVRSASIISNSVMECAKSKPVFLTGDWNAEPSYPAVTAMTNFMTIVSDTRLPTNSRRDRCIDFIMVDNAHAKDFLVRSATTLPDPAVLGHTPVVVSLETVAVSGCGKVFVAGPQIPAFVSHREVNVDGGAVFEGAEWLWHPDVKTAKGSVTLRTSFDLPVNPRIDRAVLTFSCDNAAAVRINGRELAQQSGNLNAWRTFSVLKDVRNILRSGLNTIEVDCENIADGAAGFISSLDMVVNRKTCRVLTDALAWEASLDGKSFTRAWSAGAYGCEPWRRFDVTGHARKDGKLKPQLQTSISFSIGKTVPVGRYWLLCDGFERGGLEYDGDVAFDMNGKFVGVFAGKQYAAEISRFVCAGNNELCFRAVKAQNPRLIYTPPDRGPYDLRCEYLREPLGVVRPRFCWKYAGTRPDKWHMTFRDSDGVVAIHETAEHLFVEPQLKLEPWRRYWWSIDGETETFVAGIQKWRMPFFRPGWKNDEREYWVARRKVILHGAKSVVVALCSRGSHRLYVNGYPASDGFGPNRSHIEDDVLLSETYDVTHLVREGENDFAVFVNDGWLRIKTCDVEKTSCLSIDGRAETASGVVSINSSEPWIVLRSGDRTIGGHRHSSNFGGGEHLCDKPVESAAQPGVSVDSEGFSISCSVAERDFAVRRIKPVGIVPCDDEDGASGQKVWKVDMGEAFTGFMRLRLRGRKGDIAKMSVSDNFVERCSFGQEWEYEFCGGDGVFENRLNWMAGRFFYLSGCEKPSPEDVTGIVLSCIGRRTGRFIGDGDMEKVLNMDNDTFIACTLGGVTMDCPHRERLGYGEASLSTMWGDGMPYFDTAAFYSAYLLKWASSQRSDGSIPQVSPDGRGWGGIFWSCYPVYGLAEFCQAHPDRRLVETMRPAIDKWLDFLYGHVKNGILQMVYPCKGYNLGDWAYPETDSSNWGDWGYTREGMFFNTTAYAWAILCALDTPGLVSDEARRAELRRRHAETVAAIDREWYKDGFYVSADARYQAIGLICGAAEAGGHAAATERAVLDIVEQKGFVDGGSPSYHVILRVLCSSDRGRELALRTFRRRTFPGYLFFAENGFNTLPEHWRYGRDARGSMMHTCYTGAAGVLMRGFAGIETRGDEVVVAPFLSDALPEFSAYTETPYGTVAVKVETSGESRIVSVLCPYGCRGRFVGGDERPLLPGLNRFCIMKRERNDKSNEHE